MTNPKHKLQETIRLLNTVLLNIEDTMRELDLNQNGYPTNTAGGGAAPALNASGNPGGLERYLNQPDPAAQDLQQFTTSTKHAHTAALNLHRITTQWANPTPNNTQQRGTDCIACSRYVPNTSTDRIRAALCQACHRSWTRSNKERGEWLLHRRKETAQQTVDGDTPPDRDPIHTNGT